MHKMKRLAVTVFCIILLAVSCDAAEIYTQGQIGGEFRGWTGRTVIELTNGTAWQQTDGRILSYYYSWPMVTIYIENGYFYASVYDTDPVAVRQVR
jgi:hypothetical protein